MLETTLNRRDALSAVGGGFGGLVLADLLRSSASAAVAQPHFEPRAKRVIFLFMSGGPSHVDLFDPKPEVNRRAGQRPQDVQLRTERVTGGLLASPFAFEKCG